MPENPFTAAPNHRPLHKRVMLKKRSHYTQAFHKPQISCSQVFRNL